MPSNMIDGTRVLARLDGGWRMRLLSAALAPLALESAALPVRAFFSRQGNRNYEGRQVKHRAALPDGQGGRHRIRNGQLN